MSFSTEVVEKNSTFSSMAAPGEQSSRNARLKRSRCTRALQKFRRSRQIKSQSGGAIVCCGGDFLIVLLRRVSAKSYSLIE
jgi:hypothetical protein